MEMEMKDYYIRKAKIFNIVDGDTIDGLSLIHI